MQRGLAFRRKITNNAAKTKDLISTTALTAIVTRSATNGGRRKECD
jgi:hypothetical protein